MPLGIKRTGRAAPVNYHEVSARFAQDIIELALKDPERATEVWPESSIIEEPGFLIFIHPHNGNSRNSIALQDTLFM